MGGKRPERRYDGVLHRSVGGRRRDVARGWGLGTGNWGLRERRNPRALRFDERPGVSPTSTPVPSPQSPVPSPAFQYFSISVFSIQSPEIRVQRSDPSADDS